MAKHTIKTPAPDEMHIDIEASGAEKQALLENVKKCQSGQCGCPTDEYDKLDHMDVADSQDGVKIRLKTKHGATLDANEVDKCLTWAEDEAKDAT